MENSLMSYFSTRLTDQNKIGGRISGSGPTITISREVGCNGLLVANAIIQKLNKQNPLSDWRVLSKEIFHKSAEELDLEYHQIAKIFKKTDKYSFEEILKAFGDKQFKSERKIVKTVKEVIRSFAVDGFCIIVGRAGHIIAKDLRNAIHIRLVAPLEYRIKNIMNKNDYSREQAIEFINKVEKERVNFRKAINEKELKEDNFDLTINLASFNEDALVELIEFAITTKNILTPKHQKVQYY